MSHSSGGGAAGAHTLPPRSCPPGQASVLWARGWRGDATCPRPRHPSQAGHRAPITVPEARWPLPRLSPMAAAGRAGQRTGFPMVQPSDQSPHGLSSDSWVARRGLCRGCTSEMPPPGHTSGHSGHSGTTGQTCAELVSDTPWAQHNSLPRLLLCDPGQRTALSAPPLGKKW